MRSVGLFLALGLLFFPSGVFAAKRTSFLDALFQMDQSYEARCKQVLQEEQEQGILAIHDMNAWNKTFAFSRGQEVRAGKMGPCLSAIVLNQQTKQGYVHTFFFQQINDFENFVTDIKRLENELHGRSFNAADYQIFISGRGREIGRIAFSGKGQLAAYFEEVGFSHSNIFIRLLPLGGGGEMILNQKGEVELSVFDSNTVGGLPRRPFFDWSVNLKDSRIELSKKRR